MEELPKVLGALALERAHLEDLSESSLCVIHHINRSQLKTAVHRFKVVKDELARVITEMEKQDEDTWVG